MIETVVSHWRNVPQLCLFQFIPLLINTYAASSLVVFPMVLQKALLNLSLGECMYIFLLGTYLGFESLPRKLCIFPISVEPFFFFFFWLQTFLWVLISHLSLCLQDLAPFWNSTQPTTLNFVKDSTDNVVCFKTFYDLECCIQDHIQGLYLLVLTHHSFIQQITFPVLRRLTVW